MLKNILREFISEEWSERHHIFFPVCSIHKSATTTDTTKLGLNVIWCTSSAHVQWRESAKRALQIWGPRVSITNLNGMFFWQCRLSKVVFGRTCSGSPWYQSSSGPCCKMRGNIKTYSTLARRSMLMSQFNVIKEQYQDYILLFQVGDFYEIYGRDASKANGVHAFHTDPTLNSFYSDILLAPFYVPQTLNCNGALQVLWLSSAEF